MNLRVMFRHRAALSAAGMVAVCGSALASPTEITKEGAFEKQRAGPVGSLVDLRAGVSDAERADAARAAQEFATTGRGLDGPVLMRDNLEAYSTMGGGNVAPPSFLDPPAFPWGNNTLTGVGALVDLSSMPLGGSNGVVNSSQVIRLASGSFGANLRWGPILAPGADQAAAGSSESFFTDADFQRVFEAVNTMSGFITARAIWGGECVEEFPGDCADIGLPAGPLDTFYVLGPDPQSFLTGTFIEARYCTDSFGNIIPGCTPPPGQSVGGAVPISTNNWVRLGWEFGADGSMTAILDLQDGSGPVAIARSPIITSSTFNRVGWSTGLDTTGSAMYIDNVEASGYVFDPPVAPALECPFVDSLEWLNPGPLLGQSSAWFASLSGGVVVVDENPMGQRLQQSNAGFDFYTESARRALPDAVAIPGNPWSLCVDAETTGTGTVRAFSATGPSGLAARVFIGRQESFDPTHPVADTMVYVQINENYIPSDNVPPVVGVDIVSTGYTWTPGDARTLCMTVNDDGDLTVNIGGAMIYTGQAFRTSVNSFAFESDNNEGGVGDTIRIDNVFLNCEDAPEVFPPALVLPYCDDFEWAIEGLSLDENANASGRYGTPDEVTVESVDLAPSGVSQVVAMPNIYRDTAQAIVPDFTLGEPFIFSQMFSQVPTVNVDIDTGWRVSMDFAMNDFTTSRGFSPAQRADVGPAYELVGHLWYHSPGDRFYLFASADGATAGDLPTVFDTGFTRASLGINADEVFGVQAEYIPVTGKIRWSVNGTVVGTTNPILGTDDMGAPRLHRNIDAVLVWSGDDDTAPSTPPLSTLYLDNLCVIETERCYTDVNGDGVTNFTDLNIVLSDFGETGDGIPGDVNLDGVVNFFDLNALLSQFGDDCG